jgi:transposase
MMVAVLDDQDRVLVQRRMPNELGLVLLELEPYRSELQGVAVESTYNGYWLVDGLMDAGHQVHLANTTAIQQYSGLKWTDDGSDARWLAHLLRVGLLAEGYIYPPEERAVRDLLRKRSQLVRHKVSHILSIQNLFSRNTGVRWSANRIRTLKPEQVDDALVDPVLALAVKSNLTVYGCLVQQIRLLEAVVTKQVELKPAFQQLQTVDGIGNILALTIMLETGDIGRFSKVGNYASYCRCVGSTRLSNGKKKGKGNTKNGNKYLSWAYVEAANFAIRYNSRIKRFYQRKRAKTNGIVALKAVAHKLARACYYIMRDQTPFQVEKAFG